MKSLPLYSISLLVATLLIAVIPTDAEAKIYEDTIRLHILANSDTKEDQALKLEIRDRILEKYGVMLSASKSVEQAKNEMEELLQSIEQDATVWIQELGYNYGARATLSEEWYDTREYEDFTLPAGYYTSLRVIIGDGDGKNWWCVMYPPLCTEIATERAPKDDFVIDYSREEISLIQGGKYNVKFKILEDLSRVFSKNG